MFRRLLLTVLIFFGAGAAPAAEVLRPSGASRGVVLFLSGDAGWGPSLGRKAALVLVAGGYHVVGLDSRAFFNQSHSPAEVAEWVAATARDPVVPQNLPVVVVGQSFGADWAAASTPALPAELAARIKGFGLIVPGLSRFDEVSITEFLGLGQGVDNRAAGQWLAQRHATLCIRGASETDSLCPTLKGSRVEQVVLPGGHMLSRDSDKLGATLLSWARQILP